MEVYGHLIAAGFELVTADPTPSEQTIGRAVFRTDTKEHKVQLDATTWAVFADLESAQTFKNKIYEKPVIAGEIQQEILSATPVENPPAGQVKIYSKDGYTGLFTLDSVGGERQVSGSGGGANRTVLKLVTDGIENSYVLPVNTNSVPESTDVFIDGVNQIHPNDYQVNGSTLTFTEPPPAGSDRVRVVIIGFLAIGETGDGTVTTIKLADDAVTTPKIIDDAVTTPKIINDAVTTDKIINDAITNPKLGTGSVSLTKIDANTRTTVASPSKLVQTLPTGLIDPSLTPGVPQFPTQAAAIAAGLNQNGLQYFNTTVGNYQVWLNDSAGDSSIPASFKQITLRRPHVRMGKTDAEVAPHGTLVFLNFNTVISDVDGLVGPSGLVTIKDSGTYSLSSMVQTSQDGSNSFFLETYASITGVGNFFGTLTNSPRHFQTVSSSAINISSVFLPAGTQIRIVMKQNNSNGATAIIQGSDRTYFQLIKEV